MVTSKEHIIIGRLGKPFGLEGGLYVTPATDYPERFESMTEVYVQNRSGWHTLRITESRFVGNRPVLVFEKITTPEAASQYTNCDLAVLRSETVTLPEDTYYIFDLIGCKAFSQSTGRQMGEVVDVQQYPANDVYIIRTVNDREVLYPVVKDFVKEVDIENRKIILETNGFLDEEDALVPEVEGTGKARTSQNDEV